MADANKFRLSGGLGIEPNPIDPNQQVMLQGLGFPLRPVDNVVDDGEPDISDIIASGVFMSWAGNFRTGVIYPKGSQVRDGLYIMLANADTIDPAAPQNLGSASFSQPSYSPNATDPSNVSTVTSGHIYTFTAGGWVKQLRVWVPAVGANIIYRVVIVDLTDPENPITAVVTPILSAVDEWVIIGLSDAIILAGQVFSISLEALNSSASTEFDGDWNYQGATQTGAPLFESFTVDNQRTSFRIDKTDLVGTDRGTELESVIPESTIALVQKDDSGKTMIYRVTSVLDVVTYMQYDVVLILETGGGPDAFAPCTLDFDVPIPLATEYAREASVWPAGNPAWGTVTSFLFYDDVNQNDADSGFGVDIEFQPAIVSPDWDIIVAP